MSVPNRGCRRDVDSTYWPPSRQPRTSDGTVWMSYMEKNTCNSERPGCATYARAMSRFGNDVCYTEKTSKAWHCHRRQNTTNERTATINPNDHGLVPLSDRTLDSTAKSTHDSRRRKHTCTAIPHARRPWHTLHRQLFYSLFYSCNQQGHRQTGLSQHNPVRLAGGNDACTRRGNPVGSRIQVAGAQRGATCVPESLEPEEQIRI